VPVDSASSAPTNIPDRIGQLEQLVTSMMSTHNTSQLTNINPMESQGSIHMESSSLYGAQDFTGNPLRLNAPQFSDKFGRIDFQNTETSYVDNTHWISILDGV